MSHDFDNEKFEQCIRKEFGYTDYCPIGGWLMPDGKMLDFSGGEPDGVRYRDHREIGFCLPDKIKKEETIPFMVEKLNAIRFSMFRNKDYYTTYFNIQLYKEQNPTFEQWKTLRRCAKHNKSNPIYYDIYEKHYPIHLPELDELSDDPKQKIKILEEIFKLIKKDYSSEEVFVELFGEEYR